MAVTRKKSTQQPVGLQTKSQIEEVLRNPTAEGKCLDMPENDADGLKDWMTTTKQELLQWLKDSQRLAQRSSAKRDGKTTPISFAAKQILARTEEADGEWSRFESKTDMQTGTIFNQTEQNEMVKAMKKHSDKRRKCHADLHTYRRHMEYTYAQTAWEDFLFFQNEWNRKGVDPEKRYFETKADKDAAEASQGEEEDQILTTKKTMEDEIVESSGAKEPSKTLKLMQDGNFDDVFMQAYLNWRNHIIQVFKNLQVGSRDKIPKVIHPDVAHRYSQPIRGTTNQSSKDGQKRYRHLEKSFPGRNRARLTVGENQNDTAQEETSGLIEWKIDEKICQRLKKERDLEYLKDDVTKALLPANHVLHHGCLETSFDWPTSFDSPRWGNVISVTCILFQPIFKQVEGAKSFKDEGKKYKMDKEGKRIIKVDTRPRYEMEPKKVLRRIFLHDTDANGNVLGRDRNGKWQGQLVDREVDEENFKTQGRGRQPQRFLQQNVDCFEAKYKTVRVPVSTVKGSPALYLRPHRPEKGGKGQELSEDEADDCVKSNRNFRWSGNNNPNQIGARASGKRQEDDEDLESDDEGDRFTLSYLEASNTSNQQQRTDDLVGSQGELEGLEQMEEVIPENA